MTDLKHSEFLLAAAKGGIMRKFTFNHSGKPKSSTKNLRYENGLLSWNYGHVKLSKVNKIVRGKATPVLRKAKNAVADLCFALATKGRTYDFMATSMRDRDIWVKGLRIELKKIIQTPRRAMSVPNEIFQQKLSAHTQHKTKNREAAWICKSCRFPNPSGLFCRMCHLSRESKELQDEDSSSTSNNKKGDHFELFAERVSAAQSSDRKNSEDVVLPPNGKRTWDCVYCTLINDICRRTCEACGKPQCQMEPEPAIEPRTRTLSLPTSSRLELAQGQSDKKKGEQHILPRCLPEEEWHEHRSDSMRSEDNFALRGGPDLASDSKLSKLAAHGESRAFQHTDRLRRSLGLVANSRAAISATQNLQFKYRKSRLQAAEARARKILNERSFVSAALMREVSRLKSSIENGVAKIKHPAVELEKLLSNGVSDSGDRPEEKVGKIESVLADFEVWVQGGWAQTLKLEASLRRRSLSSEIEEEILFNCKKIEEECTGGWRIMIKVERVFTQILSDLDELVSELNGMISTPLSSPQRNELGNYSSKYLENAASKPAPPSLPPPSPPLSLRPKSSLPAESDPKPPKIKAPLPPKDRKQNASSNPSDLKSPDNDLWKDLIKTVTVTSGKKPNLVMDTNLTIIRENDASIRMSLIPGDHLIKIDGVHVTPRSYEHQNLMAPFSMEFERCSFQIPGLEELSSHSPDPIIQQKKDVLNSDINKYASEIKRITAAKVAWLSSTASSTHANDKDRKHVGSTVGNSTKVPSQKETSSSKPHPVTGAKESTEEDRTKIPNEKENQFWGSISNLSLKTNARESRLHTAAGMLDNLARLLNSESQRFSTEAEEIRRERMEFLRQREELENALAQAKQLQKMMVRSFEESQKLLETSNEEKLRVGEQVKSVLTGLHQTREREESYAVQKGRELKLREVEVSKKIADVQSQREDLEAAKNAFEVKKAVFEMQVEEWKKKIVASLKENVDSEEQKEEQHVDLKNGNKEGMFSKNILKHAQIPPSFVCPITCEIMKDPVVTADGHSYERSAIQTWFKKIPPGRKSMSPQTGLLLKSRRLITNINLRNGIQEFLKDQPHLKEELKER
mmetsp:Transcript_28951/g.70586  ORF Transcript_28951/g.70586 Transcript_28951/m.70586 type:complete len:1083 (-) Transcript_28951:254-3502(-)